MASFRSVAILRSFVATAHVKQNKVTWSDSWPSPSAAGDHRLVCVRKYGVAGDSVALRGEVQCLAVVVDLVAAERDEARVGPHPERNAFVEAHIHPGHREHTNLRRGQCVPQV